MNPVNKKTVCRFDKTVIIEPQIIQHVLVDVIKRKPLLQISGHHPASNTAPDNIVTLPMDMVGSKQARKPRLVVHIELPPEHVIDHGNMDGNNLPDTGLFRAMPSAQKNNMPFDLHPVRRLSRKQQTGRARPFKQIAADLPALVDRDHNSVIVGNRLDQPVQT